jgi:hypothetical protein
MAKLTVFGNLIALLVCGCASAPDQTAAPDPNPAVARSLGHVSGARTRYSVSVPWAALAGGDQMVCVREDIDDGRGRVVPTTNYSIFVLRSGRIDSVIKDNTIMGCPNRSYSPLPPVQI